MDALRAKSPLLRRTVGDAGGNKIGRTVRCNFGAFQKSVNEFLKPFANRLIGSYNRYFVPPADNGNTQIRFKNMQILIIRAA